jgi:DNA recombination protein RmuC
VVEMAGMLPYCDFCEQQSIATEDGQFRPDLLVRLPGEKHIVVDSKVPLDAFIDAVECQDEDVRRQRQKDHAKLLRNHIQSLGKKSYHIKVDATPDFVVMFLPGDGFYAVALEQDPSIIELGVDNNVLIATPTSLIGLLRAIACGWRQESLAKNAKEISDLGKELYKRLGDLAGHLSKLGRNLNQATTAYNAAIGSLESRVLVTARKFDALGVANSDGEIETLAPVEQSTRSLMAPELATLTEE